MTAAIFALSGVMFLRMLAVFITLPVVAVYAAALQVAPSAALIGLALGGYGITQAAAQIGFGTFADRCGRKPALLVALALFALGSLWAAMARSIEELIAARLLQGAGAAAAAIMAWLADISPPSLRGRAMAVAGAGVGAAFALSLFVAAPIAGHFGAARVFDVAAVLAVIAFVMVLIMPSPPAVAAVAKMTDAPADKNTTSLWQTPGIIAIAAGAFSLHCALAVLFLLLPRRLLDTTPLADHWHLYVPAFLLSLPMAFYILHKSDMQNANALPPPVLQMAVLPMAAGLLLIAAASVFAADAVWIPAVGLWLFFIGFNAMEAILPAAASRIAPPDKRGVIMGAVLSCQFAGLFVGGFGGGMLSYIGDSFALTAAAFLILAWLVVISRHSRAG